MVAECEICGAEFERPRSETLTCSVWCGQELANETKRFANRLEFDKWPGWTFKHADPRPAARVAPMRNSCDLLVQLIAEHGERGETDEEKTAEFLRAYVMHGSARRAAALVGYPVSTHYKRVQCNAGYAAEFEELKNKRRKNARRRVSGNK